MAEKGVMQAANPQNRLYTASKWTRGMAQGTATYGSVQQSTAVHGTGTGRSGLEALHQNEQCGKVEAEALGLEAAAAENPGGEVYGVVAENWPEVPGSALGGPLENDFAL